MTSYTGPKIPARLEPSEAKYRNLGTLHCFTPVAIETSGVFGHKSLLFVRELGHCTGEVKSTNYLVQRFSVAVQRGNSAAVLGTMGHDAEANFGG